MNRVFIYNLILIVTLFSAAANAQSFNKSATVEPVFLQKGDGKQWCPICGMDIKKYYKTSHASKLPNQTPRQYCSMRCLAVDKQEYGIDKNFIKVVDAKHQKLIDAKSAYYVIGSRAMGTMTKISKFAFESKTDAQEFKKRYRGKIVDFDTALKSAQDSLKTDTAMITKKKKKRTYPMGKKIFKLMCDQNIDPTEYLEINELKWAIKEKKLCKPLNEKRLQALSLYLWDIKRFGDIAEINDKVKVKEDEKCPVCGMFTYKYPRWAAQIFYKHKDHEHHFSFDGVKDLMKFYFDHMKWGNYPTSTRKNITKILVTDYYTQKGIDATKAYYVIRSDVYGPMGHELIPFSSMDDAKTFKKDHFGKKILTFDQITEQLAYELDGSE